MKNIRYANEVGILVEQDDGVDLYVDSGELYESLKSQAAPYVAPIPTAEQLASENNAPILAEIAALEAKTLRSVRELLLTPSNTSARQYLHNAESEIATLRGQLL